MTIFYKFFKIKFSMFFLTQKSLQRHAVVHDPERKKQVTTDYIFSQKFAFQVLPRSLEQAAGERLFPVWTCDYTIFF